jgi:hypothetical protein
VSASDGRAVASPAVRGTGGRPCTAGKVAGWPAQRVKALSRRLLGRTAREWLKRSVEAPLVSRDLNRLAEIYGTDKWVHRYPPLYERHLGGRRRDVRCVLEIGVGGGSHPGRGGASLRMWTRYFPRARVYGIDVHPKRIDEARIRVFQGDQANERFLERVVRETGPVDLLIDDGSHRMDDVRRSFEVLFPHVAPGGTYVIEDLHTAYWPAYGGGPPGHAGTSVEMIKDLVDGLNRLHVEGAHYEWRYADYEVSGIHAYEKIVFLEKRGGRGMAVEDERSAPGRLDAPSASAER